MKLTHSVPSTRVGAALHPARRPPPAPIAPRAGRRRQRTTHAFPRSSSPYPTSPPVIDIAGVTIDDDDDDDDDVDDEDDGWGPDEDGWGDAGDDGDEHAPTPSFAPPSAANPPAWGPRAVCLAGFPSPETALVRSLLDRLGLDGVKVLPLSADDLARPAAAALTAPERDWAAPAPAQESGLGSGWGVGAPRVAVFGGLTPDEQAGVLAALDAAGLPMVGGVAVEAGTATAEPLGVAVAAAAAAARADRLAGRGPQAAVEASAPYTPDLSRGVVDAASLPDAAELVERAGGGGGVEVGGGEAEGGAPSPAPSAATAAGLPADWKAVAAAAGPAFMADLASNTVGFGRGAVDGAQVEGDDEGDDDDEDGGGPPAPPTGALPPSLLDVVVATSLAGEAVPEVKAAAAVATPAPAPPAKPRRGFGARPATAKAPRRPPPPPPPSTPSPDDDDDGDDESLGSYLAAAASKSGKDVLAAAAKKKKAEKATPTRAVAAEEAGEAGPPPPPPPRPPQPQTVMAEPVGLSGDEAAAHARIVADLDAKFRSVPQPPRQEGGEAGSTTSTTTAASATTPDQAALAARMRAEAESPTRDAIEAAISCGLTVEDIVAMAKAAAELRAEGAHGLAVPWAKMPRLLDPTPTEVGEAGAAGRGVSYDDDGPGAGGPASELSEEELEAMARARGLALPPRE